MISENYDQVDTELLEKICLLYDISVENLNFIGAVDFNFVFEFQRYDKDYILRGGTRHSPDQVKAELDWILFLDSFGVKVSTPIMSKKNKYHEIMDYESDLVSVVVFEKASGKAVDVRNPDEWNETLWEEMGRTLGKMHTAAKEYNEIQLEYRRKTAFVSNQEQLENSLDPIEDKDIILKFEKLKAKLDKLPKENNSFGLIQYDFHCDNFNIDNGDIIVYDFDDSYYFFFMYDLAASIHEAIWDVPDKEKQVFASRFISSLWKGYSEEYSLERKWLEYLPDFLKWREFDIYITLVETYKDRSASPRLLEAITDWILEFKQRIESEEQIVMIPENLEEWFTLIA